MVLQQAILEVPLEGCSALKIWMAGWAGLVAREPLRGHARRGAYASHGLSRAGEAAPLVSPRAAIRGRALH